MRHNSHAPRKVIAVDLDEVLAKTTLAIADFHNDTYGTTLTMDDFISYDYTKIWGGTREESIAKWRLFFDSPYFLKVEPVEGSLETLKLLKSRRFSLVIVTARQQFVADLTKKFVDRHYPGIFESIYFANHFLTEEEKLTFISKPKSVICRDVHAQLLIDDSLENATEVANAGIPVLLFDLNGSYKWNKLEDGQTLPDKVTRVKSWKEIQDWFPRPRSPLSNQCISRNDPELEIEEDEDPYSDSDSDHELSQQQYYHQHSYHNHNSAMDDSDSDASLDEDEDEMEVSKREQDEEDDHDQSQRTCRRRKLMMMDFSSSEDDDDHDAEYLGASHPEETNMDSDGQDFDLESGHGSRHHYSYQYSQVSHEELERYRHQHETMYTEETQDGEQGQEVMEVEMEMESGADEVLMEDHMEQGLTSSIESSSSTTTVTTTTTVRATHIDTASNYSTVAADYQSSELCSTIPSVPASPEAMAVESLTIKSPPMASEPIMASITPLTVDKTMDMEDVPLS
ncbi:hypothetical protein BG000_003125 [Podila horticola]|nr:hypothetical protein BG000_003125 [Podila horticola]